MSEEELRKEAEGYAREWLYHVKDLELHHKEDDKPEYIRIKEAYIAGAEPREKRIEELEKVNEWHYVKDGKPKDNEYVLIYTDLKNTYVARIPTEKDYFITRRGGFVRMSAVIAWKEIVLPELKGSE